MKKTKLTLLASAVSLVVLTGCQNSAPNDQLDVALQQQKAQYEQQIKTLEAEKSQALAAAQKANSSKSAYIASNASQSGSELFPPNAKPGHCYSRVLTPAAYTTKTASVLVKPATQDISIQPAKYANATETLLVKEASTKIITVPATYKTVTETVMVKPEHTRLVTVPAVYETISESVLDKPAHSAWKRGAGFRSSALETKIDNGTGEIMCLVEVPATYKTITKKVLKTPETVVQQVIPAQYKTVNKRVVATAATTKTVEIPAEYRTVNVKRLVTPEKELRQEIPAVYKNVTSSIKVSDEELKWAEVLCEDNMDNQTVASLQQLLRKAGTYSGPIDGAYGPLTERAANTYAKRNGLPTGSRLISLETAKHIGLGI